MRHTETEAETGAGAEAGSRQGARCGTRSRVSRIRPWAAGHAKPWATRAAHIFSLMWWIWQVNLFRLNTNARSRFILLAWTFKKSSAKNKPPSLYPPPPPAEHPVIKLHENPLLAGLQRRIRSLSPVPPSERQARGAHVPRGGPAGEGGGGPGARVPSTESRPPRCGQGRPDSGRAGPRRESAPCGVFSGRLPARRPGLSDAPRNPGLARGVPAAAPRMCWQLQAPNCLPPASHLRVRSRSSEPAGAGAPEACGSGAASAQAGVPGPGAGPAKPAAALAVDVR